MGECKLGDKYPVYGESMAQHPLGNSELHVSDPGAVSNGLADRQDYRATGSVDRAYLRTIVTEPAQPPVILTYITASVLAAVVVVVGIEHYWLRDLKFDDAWIHFRYAQNIAAGKGFVYNEGERVLGSGGILWNLILSGLARTTSPETLSPAVSILNYLALVSSALVLVLALSRVVHRWLAFIVAAALLSHGPLVVSSIGGMETVFLCLLYF